MCVRYYSPWKIINKCVPQPQLATCGLLIHLALFKWPQIWHKGAQGHAKRCFHMPCHFGLNFSKKSCKNSNLAFRSWIIDQNPSFSSSKARDCVMVHLILTTNTVWTNLRVSHALFTTLVNLSLTKPSKIHN